MTRLWYDPRASLASLKAFPSWVLCRGTLVTSCDFWFTVSRYVNCIRTVQSMQDLYSRTSDVNHWLMITTNVCRYTVFYVFACTCRSYKMHGHPYSKNPEDILVTEVECDASNAACTCGSWRCRVLWRQYLTGQHYLQIIIVCPFIICLTQASFCLGLEMYFVIVDWIDQASVCSGNFLWGLIAFSFIDLSRHA